MSPQKLFRYIFWTGYFAVLMTTFIPIPGELTKIKVGPDSFRIRLDHLLHFGVYFLIGMYYLAGHIKDFSLFSSNSLTKFILLVVILATITELVQLWVPERAFNPLDLVANIAGIVLGLIIIVIVLKHKRSLNFND